MEEIRNVLNNREEDMSIITCASFNELHFWQWKHDIVLFNELAILGVSLKFVRIDTYASWK